MKMKIGKISHFCVGGVITPQSQTRLARHETDHRCEYYNIFYLFHWLINTNSM